MNRIGLILPYYGQLPDYFELWLKTAGYNEDLVDYLLFTDQDMSHYIVPKNVEVIDSQFKDVVEKVKTLLNFRFVLDKPYKLCDYRPLYGLIFDKYLKDYEFWGHCDPDMIWGRVSHFITNEILDNYDRIYRSGHLCIYRNIPSINNAIFIDDQEYKLMKKKFGITYRDIYKHKYCAHFDEGEYMPTIMSGNGISARFYASFDFADIFTNKKEFYAINPLTDKQVHFTYFTWTDGILFGIDPNGSKKEFDYIHVQKRKMIKKDKEYQDILIYPNGFMNIPTTILKEDKEKWDQPDPQWELRYQKYWKQLRYKHIIEGAVFIRIKNKLFGNRGKK